MFRIEMHVTNEGREMKEEEEYIPLTGLYVAISLKFLYGAVSTTRGYVGINFNSHLLMQGKPTYALAVLLFVPYIVTIIVTNIIPIDIVWVWAIKLLLFIIPLFGYIFLRRRIAGYHGATHQVLNYYRHHGTVPRISNAKKESLKLKDCEANNVAIIFLAYFFLILVIVKGIPLFFVQVALLIAMIYHEKILGWAVANPAYLVPKVLVFVGKKLEAITVKEPNDIELLNVIKALTAVKTAEDELSKM